MKQHDNVSLLICLSLGYAATVEFVKKETTKKESYFMSMKPFSLGG